MGVSWDLGRTPFLNGTRHARGPTRPGARNSQLVTREQMFGARESRAWAGVTKQAVFQLNGLGIVELYTVLVTCANDDVIRSPTSSNVYVPILKMFSPLRANFSA